MLTLLRKPILGLAAILLFSLAAVGCSQANPGSEPNESLSSAAETASPLSTGAGAGDSEQPSPPLASSGSAAIAIAESAVAKSAGAATQASTAAPSNAPVTAQVTAEAVAVESPATTESPADSPSATAAMVPEGNTLLQLIDPLDEPEFYCVDIPGVGSSLRTDRPLQAHTCKPGADDELFLFNGPDSGQIFMPAFDLCMEAEGDLAYTRSCTGASAQSFSFGADGTIRTADGQLCLSVAAGEGEQTGGPSHVRRDLRLVSCAEGERHLSQWIFPGGSPGSGSSPSTRLINDALDSALNGDPWEIEKMGATGDPAYIPVLVELMRFPWWHIDRSVEEAIYDALDQIAVQNPDIAEVNPDPPLDEWFRWVVWIGKHPEIWPPPGFAGWKGRLYGELVDPAMGAFLYDGIRSNVRVEEIVWGGVAKDGIPDLTDAPVIEGVDADYLDPEDRVFGVSFNGQHRAYPHRIVNAHEMANDVVGGVPFALAY